MLDRMTARACHKHHRRDEPHPGAGECWPVGDDPEGQGMAFRAFGEQITEIGDRQFERPLNEADIAAVAFCARNILVWCGAAPPSGLPNGLPDHTPSRPE